MVSKNWFKIFLFLFVVGLIIVGAGMLFLGIGIVSTLPLGMSSLYAAFEDIFGLPDVEKTPEETSPLPGGF